jgi:hypothetical protein
MLYEMILTLHLALTKPKVLGASSAVLSSHTISLDKRWDNSQFVNDVFKDNILLALFYLDGKIEDKSQINWEEIQKPFEAEFTLNPTETFAFHEHTVKKYSDSLVRTTNSNFMGREGYRNSGNLIGDGVCHLASLMYWVADEAGLDTYNPSDHNFAPINEVPKEYGSGILSPNPLGNLYITNTLEKPVTFEFNFDGENLKLAAVTQ